MKKLPISLFLWLLLIPTSLIAQSEEPYVINAGGGSISEENIELTYFIGDYIGIGHTSIPAELTNITFYPNPVKTVLRLHSTETELDKVQIFNVQGVKIKESTLINNEVDFQGFPDGIYLLKILDKDQQSLGSVKIIKNSTP